MPDASKAVQLLPIDQYSLSGVYFLWFEGAIVYVGQAANVRRRLGQHLAEGVKLFDAVTCYPVKDERVRLRTEKEYIRLLAPKHNLCRLADKSRFLNQFRKPKNPSKPAERRVVQDEAA